MPISSSAASVEKKRAFRLRGQTSLLGSNAEKEAKDEKFLTIASAIPAKPAKPPLTRSYSTLNEFQNAESYSCGPSHVVQTNQDGIVYVSRSEKEKEKNPDRICLDRRGLSVLPLLLGEIRLRLLSLQHNLINRLEGLQEQQFPYLVFLDIYDNQLEKITSMDGLTNLRVLLMGKNRIRRIEGLQNLSKLEVLDLHGNQITHSSGLTSLSELKVLNLAGNQIRSIAASDFRGLGSLQELNLRRNRLKKLLGFGETPQLMKLFLNNNEIQSIEDMSSVAKSTNLREISIECNPVSLGGDCASFLISYLAQLSLLNGLQVTEQVRKAAHAWRRNKEASNAAFMDLTSDVCLNIRREEVISNARTNWELLRSQARCVSTKSIPMLCKDPRPDCDFILTSLGKNLGDRQRPLTTPKMGTLRSSSQDTEKTSSSTNSAEKSEYFRLPPILVPLIDNLEQKVPAKCPSSSSVGPNVDSSVTSTGSETEETGETASTTSSEFDCEEKPPNVAEAVDGAEEAGGKEAEKTLELPQLNSNSVVTDSCSSISTSTNLTNSSLSGSDGSQATKGSSRGSGRSAKSAAGQRLIAAKGCGRALTARPRSRQVSPAPAPPPLKDREQGGDYLIEISGRHLNVYGYGAIRFIDKSWNASKATEVNTVKFNYINFNTIVGVLGKIKHKFPNAETFVFRETNIYCLGQLNALAEIQGFTSLTIETEGNPLTTKNWFSYAVFRLAHWGLKFLDGKEITEEDIKSANREYQSLSDLVLWSLPDSLLQPLLTRLRLDLNQETKISAKQWLLKADPALRSVVSKEALQWRKGSGSQEDIQLRQKAKVKLGAMLDATCEAVHKLRLLDKEWPEIFRETIKNTLIDYSQMDAYMKRRIQQLK